MFPRSNTPIPGHRRLRRDNVSGIQRPGQMAGALVATYVAPTWPGLCIVDDKRAFQTSGRDLRRSYVVGAVHRGRQRRISDFRSRLTSLLRVDVGDELGFEVGDPVFQFQLALFHSRQLQLVHAGVFGQTRDCGIEVAVFFPELRDQVRDLARVFVEIAHVTRIVQLWRRMRG